MALTVSIYSTRHEAHEANPVGYSQPREISGGRWVTILETSTEPIDFSDFISRDESLSNASLAELQQWAVDIGVAKSGTKAAIIARIKG